MIHGSRSSMRSIITTKALNDTIDIYFHSYIESINLCLTTLSGQVIFLVSFGLMTSNMTSVYSVVYHVNYHLTQLNLLNME